MLLSVGEKLRRQGINQTAGCLEAVVRALVITPAQSVRRIEEDVERLLAHGKAVNDLPSCILRNTRRRAVIRFDPGFRYHSLVCDPNNQTFE